MEFQKRINLTRPLIGREDAIAAIEMLLSRPGSCVLLVGPIGVGKTHLVREIAWQFGQKTGLQVREGGEPKSVSDGLFIPDSSLANGELTEEIRRASSRGWRVFAESRERLESDFLTELLMSPLPLPVGFDSMSQTLLSPSVQLLASKIFESCATDVTDQDAVTLSELARELDGIPLFLKFFARRLTIQTPTAAFESLRSGLQDFAIENADGKREVLEWLEHKQNGLPEDFRDSLFALTLLDGVSADLAEKLFEPLNSTHVFQVLERNCLIMVEDQGPFTT